MKKKTKRDVEKVYSAAGFVARLRRLADALEAGQPFSIQVAGVRVPVPPLAIFSIEHERDGQSEELEFQLKWKRKPKTPAMNLRAPKPTRRFSPHLARPSPASTSHKQTSEQRSKHEK